MKPHPTHFWTKRLIHSDGREKKLIPRYECRHCKVRLHWPGAGQLCSRPAGGENRIPQEIGDDELSRALAMISDGSDDYAVSSPSDKYGRDGRRRNGI